MKDVCRLQILSNDVPTLRMSLNQMLALRDAFSSQSWQFYGIDGKNWFLRSRMARNRSWPAIQCAQYTGTSFSRQVNHKKLSDSHTDQNEKEDQYSQPVSVPGQFDADSWLGRTISNCRYRFEMTIWVSEGGWTEDWKKKPKHTNSDAIFFWLFKLINTTLREIDWRWVPPKII